MEESSSSKASDVELAIVVFAFFGVPLLILVAALIGVVTHPEALATTTTTVTQ